MQIGNNLMFRQSPMMGLNKMGGSPKNVVSEAINNVQAMLPQSQDTTTADHIRKIYELEKSKNIEKEEKTATLTQMSEDVEFNGKLELTNSSSSGSLSKPEWAEASLKAQHSGLNSVYNELYVQTEKVNLIVEKMAEYEGIMNGTNTDTDITVEDAEKLYNAYAESLEKDFTSIIEDKLDIYNYQADEYDKRSDGLASAISGNYLDSVTAENLGLTNLSGDPKELLEALNKAYESVGNLMNNFEDAFSNATGNQLTANVKTSLTTNDQLKLDNFVKSTEREALSKTPEEKEDYLQSLIDQGITIADGPVPENSGISISLISKVELN